MDRSGAKRRPRPARGCDAGRGRRSSRPTVMALEGSPLCSTWTATKSGNDDGSAGTLSWAGGEPNANPGADTIAFSSLFNAPQTITLTGGQLTLTDTATTTITG